MDWLFWVALYFGIGFYTAVISYTRIYFGAALFFWPYYFFVDLIDLLKEVHAYLS